MFAASVLEYPTDLLRPLLYSFLPCMLMLFKSACVDGTGSPWKAFDFSGELLAR